MHITLNKSCDDHVDTMQRQGLVLLTIRIPQQNLTLNINILKPFGPQNSNLVNIYANKIYTHCVPLDMGLLGQLLRKRPQANAIKMHISLPLFLSKQPFDKLITAAHFSIIRSRKKLSRLTTLNVRQENNDTTSQPD